MKPFECKYYKSYLKAYLDKGGTCKHKRIIPFILIRPFVIYKETSIQGNNGAFYEIKIKLVLNIKNPLKRIKVRYVHNKYRADLVMWEEKRVYLFVPVYIYRIWKLGSVKKKIRFRCIKNKSKKYTELYELALIVIGNKEMKERFKHKWLVPVNIKYNPNLP